MQLAVLLVVFDGDALAWAQYLAQQGSSSQRQDDLPLALSIATDCAEDERLRLRLRELAKQFRPTAH